MEMSLWQYYQNKIMFFERKTDELLVETILQEIKMEKRKQQRLQPTKEDIELLQKLIKSSLKAMAIEETYRYFQILQIVPTDQNIQLFIAKREQHFKELLIIFLSKVKKEQEIDFSIER